MTEYTVHRGQVVGAHRVTSMTDGPTRIITWAKGDSDLGVARVPIDVLERLEQLYPPLGKSEERTDD